VAVSQPSAGLEDKHLLAATGAILSIFRIVMLRGVSAVSPSTASLTVFASPTSAAIAAFGAQKEVLIPRNLPYTTGMREFNELVIKRRDPIIGAWHSVCISDIEPCLDLTKTGSWRVSTLVMDSVPVWKKVVSGQVIKEEVHLAQGNKLRLTWGDRAALGPLGDAYRINWFISPPFAISPPGL
jgi:hypothetical protein